MTDDQMALERLSAAGFTVAALTAEQLDVLARLTRHELDLLVDIKGRLDEAGPEVQAHGEIAGGALF
ncbi:aroma-sacti cluster domain-containing protein [Streptomyces sp. NPDC005820]|uniref:aroma-sacti cluster domain-containing protein n=1 Tax=unclassified Streptomyces TaxID=2593676 RepID=UPI0033FF53EF